MSINFSIFHEELLLIYSPELISPEQVQHVLDAEGVWTIRKTFALKKQQQRINFIPSDQTTEYNDILTQLTFCIGQLVNDYIHLDSDVFDTSNNFFIVPTMPFDTRLFIANNNISIIGKIDELVNSDVYIGGQHTGPGYLPIDDYELLIKAFPTSWELKQYARARISMILNEYFDDTETFINKYQKYLARKTKIVETSSDRINQNQVHDTPSAIFESKLYKLEQFVTLLEDFRNRLNYGVYSEKQWQPYINDIICFIFPKYMFSKREIQFERIDSVEDPKDRQPDFILIDVNGFVDVMEIKSPDIQILSSSPSYRNNHIPKHELSGAIQQIEKYLYCLNQAVEKNVDLINKKCAGLLPAEMKIRIINPQGLLVIGRSNTLNPQQTRDFELIKRQYKNIIEIMTYDDILKRIENIVFALRDTDYSLE